MSAFSDSKDWTWVVHRRCAECGFDASAVALPQLPELILSKAARWGAVLARPDAGIRPNATTWSPLEYACHVRDASRVFHGRLALMLAEDDPTFPDWDQDAAADDDAYGSQDPALAGAELTAAAEEVAAAFSSVSPADAERTGHRGDGANFTVTTLGRYFLHDLAHHLHDVRGD